MGWTFMKKPRDVKEYFREQLTFNDNKVLDIAILHRSTMYAAVHNTKSGEVWAAIFPLKFVPNASDGYDFGYKDMDETMGPVESECPERILKLLTPTDREYAIQWRERCWDTIKLRKLFRKGNRIRFEEPVSFTDGSTLSDFEVIRPGRFRSLENGGVYRISRAYTRKAELLK